MLTHFNVEYLLFVRIINSAVYRPKDIVNVYIYGTLKTSAGVTLDCKVQESISCLENCCPELRCSHVQPHIKVSARYEHSASGGLLYCLGCVVLWVPLLWLLLNTRQSNIHRFLRAMFHGPRYFLHFRSVYVINLQSKPRPKPMWTRWESPTVHMWVTRVRFMYSAWDWTIFILACQQTVQVPKKINQTHLN